MTDSPTTRLDDRLLEILRCPACTGEFTPPVDAGEGPTELVCTSCGLRYPVRNGVPVLLVDEATPADQPDQPDQPDQADQADRG